MEIRDKVYFAQDVLCTPLTIKSITYIKGLDTTVQINESNQDFKYSELLPYVEPVRQEIYE